MVRRNHAGWRRHFGRRFAVGRENFLARIVNPVFAADHRLGQKHRIVDHDNYREIVAVSRPVLGHDRLIAARNAVAANVILLQVIGGDVQHVPVPHARRKACPAVIGIRRRMRAAIEPDGPLRRLETNKGVKGQWRLRHRIKFTRNTQVRRTAHIVIRPVRTALILAHHRNPVGIVAVTAQSRCRIERDSHVIAQFRAGEALGIILVKQRGPRTGEIDFTIAGDARQNYQSRHSN